MTISSKQQPPKNDVFVVTDTRMQLLTLAIIPVMFFCAYDTPELTPIFLIICVLAIIRFRALLGGIRVDLGANIFQFPGGGLEANSILDYVNPKFFLQWFRRLEIPISDIMSVSPEVKLRHGNGKVNRTYYLRITGNFGTAKIKFDSEGKCEQCYTLLVQANDMGIPVSNR